MSQPPKNETTTKKHMKQANKTHKKHSKKNTRTTGTKKTAAYILIRAAAFISLP